MLRRARFSFRVPLLRLAPALTLALLLGPIAAGLAGTLLPAFDVLPALGSTEPSLAPWRTLWSTPGIAQSVRLTVTVGLGSTLLSLALAVGFCAAASGRPWWTRLERALPPLLATPHVAVAVGFAFLIAPSGWIARLVSPEITGWSRPPDLAIVRDPFGVSFMLGLVLKETPYLVLMILAAAGQIPGRAMMAAALSIGYARPVAWLKVVFPQIYGQIRLPIFAVMAFSLSVVDVALVLAPGHPPPLAIVALRWFGSYDLALHKPGAAAAILQLAVVVFCIALWWSAESLIRIGGRRWIEAGGRSKPSGLVGAAGHGAVASGLTCAMSLIALALWSFTLAWPYPDALPQSWTLAHWSRMGHSTGPVSTTLAIGAASTALAVLLTVACLENEVRRGVKPGLDILWLLYLPLLVPQIAFLFGVQVLLVRLGLDASLLSVAWAHLLFVLPYVFLSLADPWRSLDRRYARIAAGLGASPLRAFVRVKLPLLTRPVLVAFAVGFAVSAGQYLPTLFAGAGRVATLATETVTLAAGADRRLLGAIAILQAGLPLLVYWAALTIPRLLFRNRRGAR